MLPLSAVPTPGERRTLRETPLMRESLESWPAGVGVGVAGHCPVGGGVQVGVGVGVGGGVGVCVGPGVTHASKHVGVGVQVGHCPVPTGVQVGLGVGAMVGVGVTGV